MGTPDPYPPLEYPGAQGFWDFPDRLVASSRLLVDRPKGSAHPRYPDLVQRVQYASDLPAPPELSINFRIGFKALWETPWWTLPRKLPMSRL